MKYRTYNNMVKATKMIEAKNYDWETANELAIQCFDNMKAAHNGMPVEFWIDKIETQEEFLAFNSEDLRKELERRNNEHDHSFVDAVLNFVNSLEG